MSDDNYKPSSPDYFKSNPLLNKNTRQQPKPKDIRHQAVDTPPPGESALPTSENSKFSELARIGESQVQIDWARQLSESTKAMSSARIYRDRQLLETVEAMNSAYHLAPKSFRDDTRYKDWEKRYIKMCAELQPACSLQQDCATKIEKHTTDIGTKRDKNSDALTEATYRTQDIKASIVMRIGMVEEKNKYTRIPMVLAIILEAIESACEGFDRNIMPGNVSDFYQFCQELAPDEFKSLSQNSFYEYSKNKKCSNPAVCCWLEGKHASAPGVWQQIRNEVLFSQTEV